MTDRTARRRRRDDGTSSIELVLYMPLLMTAILVTVQFSLVYLGNQAVSAAAREAGRTARITVDQTDSERRGRDYAEQLGGGLVDNVVATVSFLDGGTTARAEVEAETLQVVPFLAAPKVREVVEGPVERFVEDVP